MMKGGGEMTAGSDMFRSWDHWEGLSIDEPRAYSGSWQNCSRGRILSGILTQWSAEMDGRGHPRHLSPRSTEVGTMLANSIENKGFSTALTLRRGSTI